MVAHVERATADPSAALGMTELEWDRECLGYVRDNTVELVVLSLQTLPQIVAESSGRLLNCAGAKAWLR